MLSPSICVTNCASLILLNCSQPGPRGISDLKVRYGKHPMHVGVASDHHLRRALPSASNGRRRAPFGHVAVGTSP